MEVDYELYNNVKFCGEYQVERSMENSLGNSRTLERHMERPYILDCSRHSVGKLIEDV